MKTDNEIIAEFMGWEKTIGGELWFNETPPLNFSKYQGKLYFDTSWDWLMDVVEKISKIVIWKDGKVKCQVFKVDIETPRSGYKSTVISIDINGEKDLKFIRSESEKSIDAVYKAVVEFIKWYNTQNHEKINPLKD